MLRFIYGFSDASDILLLTKGKYYYFQVLIADNLIDRNIVGKLFMVRGEY